MKFWEERFYEKFCKVDLNDDLYFSDIYKAPSVVNFIRSVRQEAVLEERERIKQWTKENAIPPKDFGFEDTQRNVNYKDLLDFLNKKE